MTPGPWVVSGVRGKSLPPNTEFHYVGPDNDFLAAVFYNPKTGLGWADAHLIAAAPQLLASLLMLTQILKEWHADFPAFVGGNEEAALCAARLAIAYATNQPLKEIPS